MQQKPITLSRWLMTAALLPVLLVTVEKGYAQCYEGEMYPDELFSPVCTGSPEIITDDGYAGEYSEIAVSAGETYTFASAYSTDYLTIANDAGTAAYTYGITPVTWTATVNGTVRMYVSVDADCGADEDGRVRSVACGTPIPPPTNDDANGATVLTVGSGCTSAPYTNAGATQGSTEPYATIATAGYSTVWFKFVAPASGVVKISTDYDDGTLEDSRMALFSATDSSDYSTFTEIAADDDNGNIYFDGYLSMIYATGLVAENTYYVQVGKYDESITDGKFCITVDSLTDDMLSVAHVCDDIIEKPYIDDESGSFSGQLSIVDEEGYLVAIVKNNVAAAIGSYDQIAYNISAGPGMDGDGTPYLARNFTISNDESSGAEVQLFFLASELDDLQTADTSVTLDNLKITKFSSACGEMTGTGTFITPSATGSVGNVRWLTFDVTSFSSFFIHGGDEPLPVQLLSFEGNTESGGNRLGWQTAREEGFSHYELERSADGRSFASITNIAPVAGQAGSYTYLDQSPLAGANFYRLKMVDIDGRFTLSDIVTLENRSVSEGVQVYPNPAHQYISVKGTEGRAVITMTNLAGQVVKSRTTDAITTQVDISELPAGIYYLRYVNGNLARTVKLTVK